MKQQLPFRTWLYFLAQSINLTTAVMSVSMAALVGGMLAPAPWASTLPYGCQFLLVMLCTLPASRLMAVIGRRKSFLLACLPLALSGLSGYFAIEFHRFSLLILSHALLGIYISFANFNRFAATDGLAEHAKPRAISLVVAGGVIAAFLGPILSSQLKSLAGFQPFSAAYLAFVALAAASLIINLLVPKAPRSTRYNKPTDNHPLLAQPRTTSLFRVIIARADIRLAVLISALGYGLMNLLMIQTSMQMSGTLCMAFDDVSKAIQWHVLAMFAPSFLAGRFIQTLGAKRISLCGITLILISALINIWSNDPTAILTALIILGLGWNLTYVGGSALFAAQTSSIANAVELQGINDLAISILATLGAFAPAPLYAFFGWFGTNIMAIVLCMTLLTIHVTNKTRRQH
ncbi:MAG: MFS transporter [Lautropia sp.]|nr:MFS transporter [Lautropia sp.]